ADTTAATSPAAPAIAPVAPNVELKVAGAAVVNGHDVPFDGEVEGLAWPALSKALARPQGDHGLTVIQVAREVPFVNLLRAAWTVRRGDVRVQTLDAQGAM